jgi:hypothetical protein
VEYYGHFSIKIIAQKLAILMPDGIKYGEFIVSPCKLGIIRNVSQIPIISMEAKSGSVFHRTPA